MFFSFSVNQIRSESDMIDRNMHPAAWWHSDASLIVCDLCPHACRIAPGRLGRCGVRQNRNDTLVSLVYNRPSAVHVDPIEKKPLYHFLPGSQAYSLGTVGCNLSCSFCQNCSLSTARAEPEAEEPEMTPEQVVAEALRTGCESIALTYNEPTIWAEYGRDIGLAARRRGLKMVCVTNGYIQPQAAAEFYRVIDAANVDLKAFDDGFYQRLCGGRLEPVLTTLKLLKQLGVWLEVTNLLIPEENDQPVQIRELCRWVATELGVETPLHFSAFHPEYKLTNRPCTPRRTLFLAKDLAEQAGLLHVHLGNMHSAV